MKVLGKNFKFHIPMFGTHKFDIINLPSQMAGRINLTDYFFGFCQILANYMFGFCQILSFLVREFLSFLVLAEESF